MRPDTSPLRTAGATSASLLAAVLSWAASVLKTTADGLSGLLSRVGRLIRTRSRTARSSTRRALAGPVRRAVAGPIRTGLLGRRADVSLVLTLVTSVLAVGTAWWVGSTMGYGALEQGVRGTWTGTDPAGFVFLAVTLLVVLGTLSAAVNSGLVPTTLLVSAPVFGAAVTRYGTEVTYSWGTTVVSLPDAVGVAAAFALVFGTPLAVCSFLLGIAIRRLVAAVDYRPDPSTEPKA